LVGIEGFDENCNPLSASFKYDALGRRIEKTINGKTIQYLYDGLDIVQEIENGMVTVNYIRTLNIDEPLARIESDGTIRYYHADALGSIIALTDDLGQIKTQYNYSPFGETEILGEMSDNSFQYTGRENDGTGLYYYRARYYSPKLKRFISEDPIRFDGGINFYIYVFNNPINFKDPSGFKKDDSKKCKDLCTLVYCELWYTMDVIDCIAMYPHPEQEDKQRKCIEKAKERKRTCCETGKYPYKYE
jgi:RHS repeat-associated protein